MSHLILELIIWMLVAFFIGCLIGWLLRYLFAGEKRPAERVAATPAPARPAPVAAPVPPAPPRVATPPEPPRPAMQAEPQTILPTGRMERPRGIEAARGGKPDDLQRISGIGPKNEKVLHNLGFYHFDQIAAWTDEQINWVDDHLKFNGRIGREEWVEQAALLADGKEEEFLKFYGTGGLRDKSGEKKSGSRTRRS